MQEKTVYDWGRRSNLAPSVKRADPLAWAAESAFYGAACALLVLWLLWRPLLWLPEPPGSLSDHLALIAKSCAHRLLPTLFSVDARYYAKWLADAPPEWRVALIWRAAAAAIAFVAPWILLAPSRLRGADGLAHLRGSTRISGRAASKALARKFKARWKRSRDHEIAPGVPFPGDMWTRHVLIVGGTGSGKSTFIKPLIEKVARAGEQMLLFDPKGEFTAGFAEPAILAPWDARSLAWDIAKDMRNILDMRRFAASVVKASHDPMWSSASRQLLVGLMIYLRKTRGSNWGWGELRDLVSLPHESLRMIMERWHPEANRAVEKASVTTSGILINLSSFCSPIYDLAQAWAGAPKSRRVSFVEWIKGRSRHKQIILQGHGAYGELTKSYVEAIVGVLSAMVNSVEVSDSSTRKIWFIADEFAKMGALPRDFFEVGRSRGLRCVVACQDFAQLEEIHGAPMVKALIGMCGTLVVGQIMQGETAEQLCKAFGTREVERANMSSSSGAGSAGSGGSSTLSYSRDELPLYKPSELTSRLGLSADGASVTLLLFTGGDAYEISWPLYAISKRRAAHVPAAWIKEIEAEPMPAPPEASEDEPAAAHASVAEGAPASDTVSEAASGAAPPRGEPEATPSRPADEPADELVDGLCDMFDQQSAAAAAATSAPPLVAWARDAESHAGASEGEASPFFDAAAELAAMKVGLAPLAVAAEAASALDAALPRGAGAERRPLMGRQPTRSGFERAR